MNRDEVLKKALECILGQRAEQYGELENNFETIADFWNVYLEASGVAEVSDIGAKDVAVMMGLLKIARIATGTFTADSFIDLAGYAACGGELAAKEASEMESLEETIRKQGDALRSDGHKNQQEGKRIEYPASRSRITPKNDDTVEKVLDDMRPLLKRLKDVAVTQMEAVYRKKVLAVEVHITEDANGELNRVMFTAAKFGPRV